MIQNDQELKATQERIAYFEGLVAQFRVTTAAAEFELMAGGYLSEVEKMNAEILEYLRRHPSQIAPAEAA
ncbi:MAG: hypothetical protein QOK48_2117 [Blastocatellia bacterium]|jgi:hypothetical protein|nr:hypothetical protein [Blastocatellia bacterium]